MKQPQKRRKKTLPKTRTCALCPAFVLGDRFCVDCLKSIFYGKVIPLEVPFGLDVNPSPREHSEDSPVWSPWDPEAPPEPLEEEE